MTSMQNASTLRDDDAWAQQALNEALDKALNELQPTSSPAPSYNEFDDIEDYKKELEAVENKWMGKYLDMSTDELRQLIRVRAEKETGLRFTWEKAKDTREPTMAWKETHFLPGLSAYTKMDGSFSCLIGNVDLWWAAGMDKMKLQVATDDRAAAEGRWKTECYPQDQTSLKFFKDEIKKKAQLKKLKGERKRLELEVKQAHKLETNAQVDLELMKAGKESQSKSWWKLW